MLFLPSLIYINSRRICGFLGDVSRKERKRVGVCVVLHICWAIDGVQLGGSVASASSSGDVRNGKLPECPSVTTWGTRRQCRVDPQLRGITSSWMGRSMISSFPTALTLTLAPTLSTVQSLRPHYIATFGSTYRSTAGPQCCSSSCRPIVVPRAQKQSENRTLSTPRSGPFSTLYLYILLDPSSSSACAPTRRMERLKGKMEDDDENKKEREREKTWILDGEKGFSWALNPNGLRRWRKLEQVLRAKKKEGDGRDEPDRVSKSSIVDGCNGARIHLRYIT